MHRAGHRWAFTRVHCRVGMARSAVKAGARWAGPESPRVGWGGKHSTLRCTAARNADKGVGGRCGIRSCPPWAWENVVEMRTARWAEGVRNAHLFEFKGRTLRKKIWQK